MTQTKQRGENKTAAEGTFPPATIPENLLEKLTVKDIKVELKLRGVKHTSKRKKAELLDMLKASLHMKLLYECPPPKEVDVTAKECQPPETELPWDEFHPARQLLWAELESGKIPLDSQAMGPAEVYSLYYKTMEFQMKGMEYNSKFTGRLRDLRKLMKKDKKRALLDKEAVKIALKNHPPPSHNHRGEPQWNGSVAQVLLEYDMSKGRHLNMKPSELQGMPDRPHYKAFSGDTFRWKISSIVRTQKYLYTLKFRADAKLKDNVDKMKETAQKKHEQLVEKQMLKAFRESRAAAIKK